MKFEKLLNSDNVCCQIFGINLGIERLSGKRRTFSALRGNTLNNLRNVAFAPEIAVRFLQFST